MTKWVYGRLVSQSCVPQKANLVNLEKGEGVDASIVKHIL